MQNGEFSEVMLSKGKPQPAILARHPEAVSVYVAYRNALGDDIVHVHYYRLPNGNIIPGKRPDPKQLFEDGVMYHHHKKKQTFLRKIWYSIRDVWCRAGKRYDALRGF